MRDFRYILDEQEVEAFQLTKDTRYQEKQWPEWMDSRYLMTIDEQEWLNVNDVETKIPTLGWIVNYPGGVIKAVDYTVMERATKVVPNPEPKRDPPTEVNEEALLELAAKLGGTTVDELRAKEAAKSKSAPEPPPDRGSALVKDEQEAAVLVADEDLLMEVSEAYGMFVEGETSQGIAAIKESLSKRVDWCSCRPGNCGGSDFIGCRENSPLARRDK